MRCSHEPRDETVVDVCECGDLAHEGDRYVPLHVVERLLAGQADRWMVAAADMRRGLPNPEITAYDSEQAHSDGCGEVYEEAAGTLREVLQRLRKDD